MEDDGIEEPSISYQRLMQDLFTVQRQALVELRNAGDISYDSDAQGRARAGPRGIAAGDLRPMTFAGNGGCTARTRIEEERWER
jgi:hypothetical protein